jgi:selenocysteine-specific elongation factor
LESVGQGAREIAEFLVRVGEAKRIGADRYYDTSEFERLKNDIVSEIARVGGVATPAQLREKTGLSRKFLIPALEWLDGEGVTAREGDGRRLGPNQG